MFKKNKGCLWDAAKKRYFFSGPAIEALKFFLVVGPLTKLLFCGSPMARQLLMHTLQTLFIMLRYVSGRTTSGGIYFAASLSNHFCTP